MFLRELKRLQARKTQSNIINMKISTQQTVQVDFTLEPAQHLDVAATFLEKLLDWDREYYVEDALVKNPITCYGSHSWNTVETVREASDEDVFADRVFKLMYNRSPRAKK
jgi:hypothetical protein